MEEKLPSSAFVFIWFGAAVSLAEIMAGTFFAPLGFEQGMLALVLGHGIGCVLFLLAASIGAKTGKSAMETVKISFGKYGSLIFSISNVVQLMGWTSIMIMAGAAAATYLVPFLGEMGWCGIIGALIVVWVALDLRQTSWLQTVAVVLLSALAFLMSFIVFGGMSGGEVASVGETISFGAAVELAVAMPLSWLPVVSDYTRRAQKPFAASIVSTVSYGVASCWMFALGLGAALFASSEDVVVILASAGLGGAGILVVVFSTVTTTFLDAASAGISAQSIFSRLNAKVFGIVVAVMGAVLAYGAPVAQFEGFLYLIGSIFAPMIAILIVDFYILHDDASKKGINVVNLVLWMAGFFLYRVSLSWDVVVGNTLPVLLVVGTARYVVYFALKKIRSVREKSYRRLQE